MTSLTPEIVELAPQDAIAVRGDVPMGELSTFFGRAFHEAAEAAAACGLHIVGPPFGFYPLMPAATVVVEAGFPVSGPVTEPTPGGGSAHHLVLPGGRAVQVVHVGPYDTMEQTYAGLQRWMADQGLRPASGMWECYLSDPDVEPDPATWRTLIVCPLA